MTDRSALAALVARWKKRADWAAGDSCPRDFYPQDAFGECIDDVQALLTAEAARPRCEFLNRYGCGQCERCGRLESDPIHATGESVPAQIPDNHHNALVCPYCNPKGLVLVDKDVPARVEALEWALRTLAQEMRVLVLSSRYVSGVSENRVWEWADQIAALLEET